MNYVGIDHHRQYSHMTGRPRTLLTPAGALRYAYQKR